MAISNALAIDATSQGFADAKHFGFEMNAMAFHAVIDGMYSNKMESPIREYMTNAFDAHIMVGAETRPFEVQAPSQLNPYFRVRDFGPGMTHDQIMHHATTMFASGKRETNLQVGKWGLGMKSAFAYTNIYSIIAYDGRTKRVYNCFLDEGSMPTVASLPVEICHEPAGIEISFPVKTSDIYNFNRAISRVMIGFEPSPRVVNETWQPTPVRTLAAGDNWVLVKHDQITSPHVKQGCVLYPLDLFQIHRDGIDSWSAYNLHNMPMIIDMPIGTVEVSTSRELISYDIPTVQNLREAFIAILDTVREEMAQSFLTHPTYHSACQALRDTDKELIKLTGSYFLWKDGTTKLRTEFEVNGRMSNHGRACRIANKHDPRFASVKEQKIEPYRLENAVILYEDEDNLRALARVRTYCADHIHDRRPIIWVKGFLGAAQGDIGPDLEVVKLSTIEPMKPEKSERSGMKTTRSDVRHLSEGRHVEKDFDLDEGGIFLFTDGHDYEWMGRKGWSFGQINSQFLAPARELGLLGWNAYALVSTQRTVLQKHEGWVNLADHLRSRLVFDPKRHALKLGFERLHCNRVFKLLQENIDRLPKRLQNFVRKVGALDYGAPTSADYKTHALWQNLTGKDVVEADCSLVEEFRKFEALYPLFDEIASISWHDEKREALLSHYLKLITKG